MAVHTLASARAGLETTRNTGVTPTRILYFDEGTHDQSFGLIRPKETRASFVEAYRADPGIQRNAFTFGGPLTFDQAIEWANLHIKAVASGTGGAADKTWTFLPTHTSDDIKSATIQYGYTDSIGATRPAWEVVGCLGEELTLTWAKGEVVQFSSRLLSAKGATQISAFTGALSDVTTISPLGTATQIFIDTSTIGSTADSDVLDFTWTLTNGWVYLDTLDNTGVAKELIRTQPKTWRLELTRYFRNDTELDLLVLATPRKVRIRTLGPVLGGSFYKIDLDLYGVFDGESYSKTEVDGMGVEKFTLVPIYDATATTDMSLTIVNATGALT